VCRYYIRMLLLGFQGSYLGDEDEAEEKRHGELTVTEEDDVEEVGIGGTLEKEPVEHTNTNNE